MARPNEVPDQEAFRRKVILGLVASPWTLIPFLTGVSLLLGAWTFSLGAGITLFSGIAASLIACGIFLTRLLTGTEALSQEAMAELEAEAKRAQNEALDELEKRLVADQDPRTEAALQDLRALLAAFMQSRDWGRLENVQVGVDILGKVRKMFEGCVEVLEQGLALYHVAKRMRTEEARRPILEQRERLIQDVETSIGQLGGVLAGLERLGVEHGKEESELARIRNDLDQSLEVAKMVEKRMQRLTDEMDGTLGGE